MFVEHADEQKHINEAESLSRRGWSQQQIVNEFKRRGWMNRYGRPWTQNRIWQALQARKKPRPPAVS